MVRIAIAAILLAWIPAAAFASGTVVLLPPGGDAALADERAAAQSALSLALEGQGFHIVAHDAVAHDEDACASVDCAPVLLRDAGANLAAAVAVWGESFAGQQRAAQVYVTLVDAAGNRYPGAARVPEGDVAAAARTALLDARALQLLGPGPWLRVRGVPEGAEVHIDDKLVGSLPYRARIDAGRHALEVRAEGMHAHVESVIVPPNQGRVIEIEVALGPASGADATGTNAVAPADDSAESPRDNTGHVSHPIVGPLVLGGVGVALVGVTVAQALSGDCLRREPTGTCTREREPNTLVTVALGGAAAIAVAGSVLWYIVGAEDSEGDSAASIRPQGMGVTGRF